jgi:histidinol-phosphate aminotransferase
LARALRDKAVLVRHFAKPRVGDYLRITVGTDAQTGSLLSALGDILG